MNDSSKYTVREAINDALDHALANDDRVCLLGPDIADPVGGTNKATLGLSTRHGNHRVVNTPLSVAAVAGAAIGAAIEGLVPVVEIPAMDSVGGAVDQIVNHAAKLRYLSAGRTPCPAVFRVAAFAGMGRGATNSQSFEGWFAHVPGLKVIVPSSPADTQFLLSAAIADPDPCVFVENIASYDISGPRLRESIADDLGRATIKRVGSDVTVVTYGLGVFDALNAAASLAAEGIEVEIVDLRSLVPFDLETVLKSVRRTRRVVVAHHATTFGGPGAEISALIGRELFGELLAPIERVGAPFVPSAPSPSSVTDALLGSARIDRAVRVVVGVAEPVRLQ